MKYDAIIIGGGPAGVIAAYTIAKENKKVILIDEKQLNQIGDKVCGDALRKSHVNFISEKIGLNPPNKEELSDEIDYFVIKTSNNEMAFFAPDEGIVVNRKLYGQRLLREIENIGVKILPETSIKELLITNDYLVGVECQNKKTKITETNIGDLTIDCSGRNHIIRKKMPQNTFSKIEKEHSKTEFSIAYREILKLKKKNEFKRRLVLVYDKTAPEPGYFWIFSKGDYEVNVGIGWADSDSKKQSVKQIYDKILSKYFMVDEYEVIYSGGYTIPTRYPLLNAVGNGFITAGDAAFHTDPFLAEGHGPALLAGYYAGYYALRSINSNNYSEEMLWPYNIAIMNEFGITHIKSQLFVKMLTDVGMQDFFDFMLGRKIITLEEFRKIRQGKKFSKFSLLKKIIKIMPHFSYLKSIWTFQQQLRQVNEFYTNYPVSPQDFEIWNNSFSKWLNQVLQIGNERKVE